MNAPLRTVAAAALTATLWIHAPLHGQGTAPSSSRAVSDTRLSYTVQGQGPPLLLLHNFTGCGQVWEPHLARFGEHFRLIIPDLPGHGASSNPPGAFTHRQAARDVLALLDRLGIQRLKAMGMSSGGMTLLHMATQQPGRVEAMVLIGATTYFPEEARAIMRKSSPADLSPQARERLLRCHGDDAQIRRLFDQFHGFKDSYDDMSFTEPHLATITARTLIVHGDRDDFFPVSIPVQMYGAIPRSALWIVPGGEHIPIFGDRAEAFQDVALAFLRAP